MSVTVYRLTWHNISEDLNLQQVCLSVFMFSEFLVIAMQCNQISRKSVESGFTLQGFWEKIITDEPLN